MPFFPSQIVSSDADRLTLEDLGGGLFAVPRAYAGTFEFFAGRPIPATSQKERGGDERGAPGMMSHPADSAETIMPPMPRPEPRPTPDDVRALITRERAAGHAVDVVVVPLHVFHGLAVTKMSGELLALARAAESMQATAYCADANSPFQDFAAVTRAEFDAGHERRRSTAPTNSSAPPGRHR